MLGIMLAEHDTRPLLKRSSCVIVLRANAASCHRLIFPSSCQLIAPACCCITSLRPLAAPRVALSSYRCTGWLLHRLSMHCPLIVSSSRRAASCCLVLPAGCRAIISRHPLVALPSCPLIVLAGRCVASHCTTLLSSHCSPSPMPSNAVERSATIERHLYRPPVPQLPSIVTVKRKHPPSSIVALPLDALPSCCLVVSSCRHSLSCRAS